LGLQAAWAVGPSASSTSTMKLFAMHRFKRSGPESPSQQPSGERTLAGCWFRRSAETNLCFGLLICVDYNPPRKFAKAKRLRQHASRVRSPESRGPPNWFLRSVEDKSLQVAALGQPNQNSVLLPPPPRGRSATANQDFGLH